MKIQVTGLLKPSNVQEGEASWQFDESTGALLDCSGIKDKYNGAKWMFDSLLHDCEDATKLADVAAKKAVSRCILGEHGTVMMYGQPSSGKSYGLFGDYLFGSQEKLKKNKGLAMAAVESLFEQLKKDPEWGQESCVVTCSFHDIWNERIRDCISGKENLALMEDKNGVTKLVGLSHVECKSAHGVEAVLTKALRMREGFSEGVERDENKSILSCRSHAIFQLSVVRNRNAKSTSTLSFVDLAGVESGMVDDLEMEKNLKQDSAINKSLVTLRRILAELAFHGATSDSPSIPSHLAFRESKLTRVLASQLSGNSLLSIVLCLSLSPSSRAGTLHTLKFANKCMFVETDVPPTTKVKSRKRLSLGSVDDTTAAAASRSRDTSQLDISVASLSQEVEQALNESKKSCFEDIEPIECDFSKERVRRLSEIALRPDFRALGLEPQDDFCSTVEEELSIANLANQIDSLLMDSQFITLNPTPKAVRPRDSIQDEIDTIRGFQNNHVNRYEELVKETEARLEMESERRKRLEFELEVERERARRKADAFKDQLTEVSFEKSMLQRSLVQRQEHLESVGSQLSSMVSESEQIKKQIETLQKKLEEKEAALRLAELEREETEQRLRKNMSRASLDKAIKVLGLQHENVPKQPQHKRKSFLKIRRASLTPSFTLRKKKPM